MPEERHPYALRVGDRVGARDAIGKVIGVDPVEFHVIWDSGNSMRYEWAAAAQSPSYISMIPKDGSLEAALEFLQRQA